MAKTSDGTSDVVEQAADQTPESGQTGAPTTTVAAVDPVTGSATSALASDGTVKEIPKTPEAQAELGSKISIAGDFASGGNPAESTQITPAKRLWGMDADHTTNDRNNPFGVKPDATVIG